MKQLSFLAIIHYGLLAISSTQAATTNAFASTTTSDQEIVTLNVSKVGMGTVSDTVTSSVSGSVFNGMLILCGTDCNESFSSKQYSNGFLTATPATNYAFIEWTNCPKSEGNKCYYSYNTGVSTTLSITANFGRIITIAKPTHGKVIGTSGGIDHGSINCSATETACSTTFRLSGFDYHPTGFSLKAVPDDGYQFLGWQGIANTDLLTDGDIENSTPIITAIFEPKYAVTITKEGKGTVQGQTLENNAVNMGIMCGSDCNESYNKDTSLTLTATPDSGYIFKGWSGATCSGTGACTIKVTQPLNISALFESTTPTPTTTQPDPTKPFSASLSFAPLKQIYRPGDKLEVDLNAKLNAPTQFDRVDLWVVISAPHLLPKDHYLFMTPKPFEIFSTEPQALKFDLERLDQAVRVLTFDIIPGFGGQYTLFAAFVKSGKNPFTDGFLVLKSEIAIAEVIFTND